MLQSVFERAQRDRVVTFNPCAHTELPKVIRKKTRTLTPEEFDTILASLPAQHRLMVETAINTGLRWGELIALKPRHLDLIKRKLTVEETVVEVSIKNSPTGARMLTKPYPKDNEPRTMAIPADLVPQLADSITTRHLDPDDLLFATRDGTPSRATPSAPASGYPPSKPPASTSTSASTTSATPTPPGSSQAAPTSNPSWTAWATPKSSPPRNTYTPSPTPTPRTSTPSTGSFDATLRTPTHAIQRSRTRTASRTEVGQLLTDI